MRGRKPKPKFEAADDAAPPRGQRPRAPSFLTKAAREEFDRVAREAWPDGRLDATTLASFAAYAAAYARWKAAESAIAQSLEDASGDVTAVWLVRKPTGTLAIAPLMQISRAAALDTVKFASECGITAVARERTKLKSKIRKDDPANRYLS